MNSHLPCCAICRKHSLHNNTDRLSLCAAQPGEFCLYDFSPIDRSMESFFEDSAIATDGQGLSKPNMPPWEKETIAQIPYVDPLSALLTAVEREALPSLPAPTWDTPPSSKPHLDASTPNYDLSQRKTSFSLRQTEDRIKTPLTAPIFASSKSVSIPAAPRTSPELPSFVLRSKQTPDTATMSSQRANLQKLPPTPSDSEAGSWGISSTFSSPKLPTSPPSPPATVPNACCHCGHRKRPSRLARWKSALKDIFKHDYVDDSELEHIETSHWTDE